MALNPKLAICAIPASRLICHRPCGAQFDVSMPNQLTALIRNGLFDASKICDPAVCRLVMAGGADDCAVTGSATARVAAVAALTMTRHRRARPIKDRRPGVDIGRA